MHCVKSFITHLRQPQTKVVQRIITVNLLQNFKRYNFTQEEDETDQLINELCKGDPEAEKRLKILMLEVEVMRQDGRCAPNSLKIHHWRHLMELFSRNQRTNYLLYLFKTEKAKENDKARKLARQQERVSTSPEENKEFPDDLLYGITNQSLFLRIRDQSINNFDNYRALQAITHSQPIVLDCSYEQHMVHKELVNAAKQVTFVFGDNRIHKDPFNLHMCNMNFEGIFMEQLRRNIPSIEEPWFPINMHTNSYLDIFPKEKLVYLTPHCREEMGKFDHDAVYIIGCMVDKMNNEPLSLAKAKRDGIKMARLPLERYLEWAPGSKKNLNINHMMLILLDLRLTGSWDVALKHIPRRKLMETKILAMQRNLRNPLLKKELMKNFSMQSKIAFRDKRLKSRKSLYDDDNL